MRGSAPNVCVVRLNIDRGQSVSPLIHEICLVAVQKGVTYAWLVRDVPMSDAGKTVRPNRRMWMMLAVRKHLTALFVDRTNQQWIVRDPEGNYWILPVGDDPWDNRQPFQPTEEAELEPIPGHYKYLLRLPF